jgi:hypothetical protein
MAIIDPNTAFQSWILTPSEQLQGSILTITQKQVIQNRITQLAHSRLNLSYDPINPSTFLQIDADLRGQLLALTGLLDSSNLAETEMANPSPQE